MNPEKIIKSNEMVLVETIGACVLNGNRILEKADWYPEHIPSAIFFLSLIAQEEFAKAFILYLAEIEVIPWNQHIFRATRDHKSKQLILLIMDYVSPDIDEFIARINTKPSLGARVVPKLVMDAIALFRYEKIGRWESKRWDFYDDPDWSSDALNASEGQVDLKKQNSLYVKIGPDGSLISIPDHISEEMAQVELERAKRFSSTVDGLSESGPNEKVFIHPEIETYFKEVFAISVG